MADVSLAIEAPLSTRACADYLGYSTDFIRVAIDEGVRVGDAVVKLEAETIGAGPRRRIRIHPDKFVEFLRSIGWKRVPALRTATHN